MEGPSKVDLCVRAPVRVCVCVSHMNGRCAAVLKWNTDLAGGLSVRERDFASSRNVMRLSSCYCSSRFGQ